MEMKEILDALERVRQLQPRKKIVQKAQVKLRVVCHQKCVRMRDRRRKLRRRLPLFHALLLELLRRDAGQLRDHGIDRAAGRLKEALEGDLNKNAERAQNADVQVRDAVIDDSLNIRLRAHVSTDADQACDKHEQIAQPRKQQTVDRDLIDALGVFLPQRARQQRVDADAEANGNSDNDVLPRKSHRHRRECILAVSAFSLI